MAEAVGHQALAGWVEAEVAGPPEEAVGFLVEAEALAEAEAAAVGNLFQLRI